MVDVHTIASFISLRYEYQYGSRIDEMNCIFCFILCSVSA